MGNSKSKTVKINDQNIPIKPAIKKTPAFDPFNRYNYNPTSYIPEQYVYPTYRANYPVVSSEKYLQNEFVPQSTAKNKVLEQNIPGYHHDYRRHSHHHRHHQHTAYGDHHHHHHHRPVPPPEKEHWSAPILTERATSPGPPPFFVPAQKPVSSVVTYKIASPVANKKFMTPSQPVVYHLPSVSARKSSIPISTEKPLSPVHQSAQPMIFTSLSSPLSATSDGYEKVPIIKTNYVAKSADSHSINNYEPGTISIVKRSSLRSAAPGNRWYDHDYNKRIKPLTVNDD